MLSKFRVVEKVILTALTGWSWLEACSSSKSLVIASRIASTEFCEVVITLQIARTLHSPPLLRYLSCPSRQVTALRALRIPNQAW